MQLFDQLNDSNFVLYAAKHYYNPKCIDSEEFFEDLKRIKYIKRLLNRYIETDGLSERLILNHLIVIFNVFTIPAGIKLLNFRLDDQHWPIVKPFLIYLKVIEQNDMTGIVMDPIVIDALRKT